MDPSLEEHSNAFPRKRARTNHIIHCTDEDFDSLVSPKDLESWNTLLGAAKKRKHTLILEIAKELPQGEIPQQYNIIANFVETQKYILINVIVSGKVEVS